MENVVIGAFTVLRMVARPYAHAIDLAFPPFFVPFFALHYGGFVLAALDDPLAGLLVLVAAKAVSDLRLMGSRGELKKINRYVDMRIAEEGTRPAGTSADTTLTRTRGRAPTAARVSAAASRR